MKYYIINHSDNEREGYQSSLNGSYDNFNFNDDYAQNFFWMFILLFCFLFQFLDVWKIRICIWTRLDEFL